MWCNSALFVIFFTITYKNAYSEENDDYIYNQEYSNRQYTRTITIKQGQLKGLIVEPRINRKLPPVEQFRGIPYAAAPVGELRFMPSGSAPSWTGIKMADTYGPVCPQVFPDDRKMAPDRKAYFLRLKEYLMNQNEDCLYLNIYAPFQEIENYSRRYPVMVFIHGESYEWNSGNPYDGSVLAACGKVIVVTLNFRLGILGFLKAGIDDYAKGNFGLVDQIAALLWVKENIAAFGGDPGSVTLFGHGTGAACASLLMLSPFARQGNEMLFQKAILMGGTALSDWALAVNPVVVTYQVSQALDCQIQDDFAGCLRRKGLQEILNAGAKAPPYRTKFGPVIDTVVVPNDPKKSMTQFSDIFKSFEMMYGVSEMESIHLLGPVEQSHGMLERERDEELRNYVRSRCESEPELCLARTLAQYIDEGIDEEKDAYSNGDKIDTVGGKLEKGEPDRATMARDVVIDALSDARSVAPLLQTGKYHAAVNLQSYFYVFKHRTFSKEYIRNKSYSGDELPYVFGVPLDGPKFHYVDHYTEKEKLFSEIIMMYFSSFAHTGNPNVPRKSEFYTLGPSEWFQYDVDWPEFDITQERYLQLQIPPQPSDHYRSEEMAYWNEVFPELVNFNKSSSPNSSFRPTIPIKPYYPPRGKPPPWVMYPPQGPKKITSPGAFDKFEKFYKTAPPDSIKQSDKREEVFGIIRQYGKERPYNIEEDINEQKFGVVYTEPPVGEINQAASMNLLVVGGLFLIVLINIIILGGLYYKCYKSKKNKIIIPKTEEYTETTEDEKRPKLNEQVFIENGCNIVKIISRSSKHSDDTYEPVKTNNKSSNVKLKRQMSNSTIDAHTKVRDWITQEIVSKYSPRFLRKPRVANPMNLAKRDEHNSNIIIPIDMEKDSTLGRSPTRPVSPSGDLLNVRPSLSKQGSLNKPEKVSVAIDATPSGRGPSVLMQKPIELTKSLDYPNYHTNNEAPLRRSATLEDFSPRAVHRKELRKSITSINLKYKPDIYPTVIKIEHNHSKSDPVEDLYSRVRKLKTFDPNADVNVTCREEVDRVVALTPEESLMTIKRRNFPKVLPDHPGREALANKRRSMPLHSLFLPIPENSSFSQPNSPMNKSLVKSPPTPPPRKSSTLERQGSIPLCSEPMLAEEPPTPVEPEVTCNNLYVGPLIPKNQKTEPKKNGNMLNTSPIYESLKNVQEKIEEQKAKAIVSANPGSPRRSDPKYVVKPSISKKHDYSGKGIPRVVVPDNQPHLHKAIEANTSKEKEKEAEKKESNIPVKVAAKPKLQKSHIPVKSVSKESSGSESTSPSEESDTGTVVKRI